MRKDSGDRVLRFAKRQWSMADRDGDGSLDVKEIITMIGKVRGEEKRGCWGEGARVTDLVHRVTCLVLFCLHNSDLLTLPHPDPTQPLA